jgi:iron complex transport system substrate-binding protein
MARGFLSAMARLAGIAVGSRVPQGAVFAVLASFAAADATAAPHRVVSMNVCTDQLAMLIAGEGQLYSVSNIASDERTSALASQAGRYAVNNGFAEEIFMMKPDLVLAGTFTSQATVDLLRRLGFRVEQFAPASSFDDIRADLIRMGSLLGREDRAASLVSKMDQDLEALRARSVDAKSVAIYYANSYAAGTGTLADAVIRAAGLRNVGETLGAVGVVRLPLELLVLADPDLVVAGDANYRAPALAMEAYAHPAFRALGSEAVASQGQYWICGAPFTVEAARLLQDAAIASGRDSR